MLWLEQVLENNSNIKLICKQFSAPFCQIVTKSLFMINKSIFFLLNFFYYSSSIIFWSIMCLPTVLGFGTAITLIVTNLSLIDLELRYKTSGTSGFQQILVENHCSTFSTDRIGTLLQKSEKNFQTRFVIQQRLTRLKN